MTGSPTVRFSDLFADTVATHGVAWAHRHYIRRGMPAWEFGVWLATVRVA